MLVHGYDPVANLVHWGGVIGAKSMERFGLNPYGKPLYRIIRVDTRRHFARNPGIPGFPEGAAAWLHKYPGEVERSRGGNASSTGWALEQWRSPERLGVMATNLTEYNKTAVNPMSAEGDYELCFEFEACNPGHANIDKIIQWVEMGDKRRPIENYIAVRDLAAKEKETNRLNRVDKLKELMPAFADAPVSGYGGGSGTKTKELRLTARAAHLPTQPMQAIFKQAGARSGRLRGMKTPNLGKGQIIHAS